MKRGSCRGPDDHVLTMPGCCRLGHWVSTRSARIGLRKRKNTEHEQTRQNLEKFTLAGLRDQFLLSGVCVALFACVSTKLILGVGAPGRPEPAGAHETDATRGREFFGCGHVFGRRGYVGGALISNSDS